MNAVVASARSWIGTPYVHQASVRGSGADCLGLLLGVWRDLCSGEPEVHAGYTEDWIEPSGREQFLEACRQHMTEVTHYSERRGDILLFRMRDASVAKHLGIQTEIGAEARFVHAYSGRGVVETSLSLPWQRRTVARFVLPCDQSRSA